jgi:hypothetical protein
MITQAQPAYFAEVQSHGLIHPEYKLKKKKF